MSEMRLQPFVTIGGLLILMLWFSGRVDAQRRGTAKTRPNSKPAVETIDADPNIFDDEGLKKFRIPRTGEVLNFNGTEIERLTRYLGSFKAEVEKSEFESEADYISRMEKLYSEKVFEGTPLNKMVFIFKAVAIYDAEAEEFSIYLPVLYARDGMWVAPFASYVERANMAWNEKGFDGFKGIYNFYSFKVKVSKEKAKDVKDNFGIAVRAIPIKSGANFPLTLIPKKIYVFDSITEATYMNSIKRY